MTYQRWVFEDESGTTAAVEINPNKMSTPTKPARTVSHAIGARFGNTRTRTYETPATPRSWNFGGVILTQEHHDMLLEWSRLDEVLRVTDHLGRTFEILIESFDPIERTPTIRRWWRFDFTMNCLLLGEA